MLIDLKELVVSIEPIISITGGECTIKLLINHCNMAAQRSDQWFVFLQLIPATRIKYLKINKKVSE
jgi:hypothetical protein